jgi:hypothetical protein
MIEPMLIDATRHLSLQLLLLPFLLILFLILIFILLLIVVQLHTKVCTSTDTTAGKSLTIASQLSPASAEAYTCPPVVPK